MFYKDLKIKHLASTAFGGAEGKEGEKNREKVRLPPQRRGDMDEKGAGDKITRPLAEGQWRQPTSIGASGVSGCSVGQRGQRMPRRRWVWRERRQEG